jgi:hypothetical protein
MIDKEVRIMPTEFTFSGRCRATLRPHPLSVLYGIRRTPPEVTMTKTLTL